MLASGGGDHDVRLWDVRSGRSLACMSGHAEEIKSVAFKPRRAKRVASGSGDKKIKTLGFCHWRRKAHSLSGHTEYVYSVVFSPDGREVFSGSEDGDIKRWDVSSGQLLKTFKKRHSNGWVKSIAISPDGRTLASGDADKLIHALGHRQRQGVAQSRGAH